jgi:WD40 repeat protein
LLNQKLNIKVKAFQTLLLLLLPYNIIAQQTELSVQTGHVAAIRKVVFSPDGNFLASSDEQHKICIWDMISLTQMSGFYYSNLDEQDKISSLAFSTDSRSLVAATDSGEMLVWDIPSSSVKAQLNTGETIKDVQFINETVCLIVASKLFALRINDDSITDVCDKWVLDLQIDRIRKELSICTWDGETDKISYENGFVFKETVPAGGDLKKNLSWKYSFISRLKPGKDIIVAGGTFQMRFYSQPSGEKLFSASAPYLDEKITALEYLPQDNYFLESNTDGKIYVFDPVKRKLIRTLTNHLSEVNTLAVHPSGNIFASGSTDRSIIIWDASDFKEIKRFYARASAIESISLSNHGSLLAFGNELGYTKMIDLADKSPDLKAVRNHRQRVSDIVFTDGNKSLITCSDDNHITKLDAATFKIEENKKFRTNFGVKYLLYDIIEKLKLYVDPYIFIDSLSLSDDQKSVAADGYKMKHGFFHPRYTEKQFEYFFSTSDLKKQHLRNFIRAPEETFPVVDSMILGIDIFNKEYGHISGITGAIADKERNMLITSSLDATIKLWDLTSKKLIITIIPVDKNKRIFITPDNYYFAPKNSLNAIGFKQGTNFYPPEQFDLKYNRPDIVLERMDYPDTVLIKMYRNAYEKRLRKSGFNETMFTSEWHVPTVKIINSDETGYTTDQPLIQLKISGNDSRYNLNRLNVWVNDVPVYGANGISLKAEGSNSVIRDITIPLSSGENRISLSCMNEKGVESLKESKNIICNYPVTTKPDLHVIAMSVSKYKDNRFNLQYSVKDGKDIAAMFGNLPVSTGEYNKIVIDTLFNENAVREKFFGLKKELMKTNVNDEVLLFVSGHGLLDRDLNFYFASWDMDFSQPEKRGISFDDLENLLDSIPARKKLLMVDACHSGEVDKEDATGILTASVEKSQDITFRGGNIKEYSFRGVDNPSEIPGVSLDNSFDLMQEMFAGLDKGTGTTVISAAAGKGYALESAKWNNGVFTYTILNGLKNRAADENKDKKITISELKDYSITQVEQLTGGKQKPTARREAIGVDWRIW